MGDERTWAAYLNAIPITSSPSATFFTQSGDVATGETRTALNHVSVVTEKFYCVVGICGPLDDSRQSSSRD